LSTSITDEAVFLDGVKRKRAAALIFLGSLFGLCGFFFAFVTGVIKSQEGAGLYPSGYGYFPSTVSEMVANPRDAAGKAFFAFEFIAAIFIFLSWYPYQLHNVYIGDDDQACCGISWVLLRQFIPAPGMMLVATVTTTPIAMATIRDQFTIFIHLSGAMMMFVGYTIIEGKTLGMVNINHQTFKVADRISAQELWWRRFFVTGVNVWLCTFMIVQVILGIPGIDKVICCNDEYDYRFTPDKLVNTASSVMLVLKVISYVAEVLCGWSLIMSHATIWYFCEERLIDDVVSELAEH
jgi:hypothetical protein